MNRRTFVASLTSVLVVGGCLGQSTPSSTPEKTKRERLGESGESEETGRIGSSLTDCGETHVSMHDSVI